MVSPIALFSAQTTRERLSRIVAQVGGQRAFSRLTGVPRSTLQDFLSGRVETPSRRTVEALTRPVRDEGIRTVRYHSAGFTEDSLRNLIPPPGSNSFRLVSERIASPGREFGSTGWIDRETFDLGDVEAAFNLDAASIASVVFNKVD